MDEALPLVGIERNCVSYQNARPIYNIISAYQWVLSVSSWAELVTAIQESHVRQPGHICCGLLVIEKTSIICPEYFYALVIYNHSLSNTLPL